MDREAVSNLFRPHLFVRQLGGVITSEIWKSYFKFAFVRNPWERLVSWHAMCLQRPGNDFQRHIFEKYPNFDDFIENATEGIAKILTFNQLDYICDEEGNIIVDFVGRMERFNECCSELFKMLNTNSLVPHINIPHINKSDHDYYRSYYNDHTIRIVAERFRKDIDYFGYRF
jgi:hypothetical protein